MSTSDGVHFHDDTLLPSLQPEGARIAARRVYDLLHLRTAIIRPLAKHELATMLRVDKRGMEMVARELYHTMKYNEALVISSDDPSRLEMYESSVIDVSARSGEDVYSMDVSLADRLAFGFDEQDPDDEEDESDWDLIWWLRSYHPEMVNLLVPPLRNRFPFLQTIEFGEDSNPLCSSETWTVHLPVRNTRSYTPALPPTSPHSQTPPSPELSPTIGHVHHVKHMYYNIGKHPPPSVMPSRPRPRENYSFKEQYDLSLGCSSRIPTDATRYNDWLVALRTASWLGSLYKGFDSGPVRINTADLVNLYARQDQSGLGTRLEVIDAERIIPPSISDFGQLATVASTSLTRLVLCDSGQGLCQESEIKITFKDLMSLFKIIQDDLPNLVRFEIAVKGASSAEEVCRSMLSEDTLDKRGTLRSLRILSDQPPSFPFNVLRVASAMMRGSDYDIGIGLSSDCIPAGAKVHTALVSHLRSQTPRRRRHLSTVDFPSLDVTTPLHVQELQYTKSGKPMRRGEKIAKELLGELEETEREMTHEHLPTLAAKLTRLTAAATRLLAVSRASSTTAQMLAAGREIMDMVESVAETGSRVQEIVEETQTLGVELEEYLRLLESVEGNMI